MVTHHIARLEKVRALTRLLEQKIAEGLRDELAALPTKYGFGNADEFANAVRAARLPPVEAPAAKAKPKPKKNGHMSAAKLARLRSLHAQGKSGQEIAKTLRISESTVSKLRSDLGLTQPKRKGKRAKYRKRGPFAGAKNAFPGAGTQIGLAAK